MSLGHERRGRGPLLNQGINAAVLGAGAAYYRLVLLVGPHGSGKTRALRSAAAENDWPLVDLGLNLATELADVPPARRPGVAPAVVERLVAATQSRVVAVDDIEVLFESSLQLKPLELLKRVSRSRVVVASWPGSYADERLQYAIPGRPEHLSLEASDVSVVSIESIPSQ